MDACSDAVVGDSLSFWRNSKLFGNNFKIRRYTLVKICKGGIIVSMHHQTEAIYLKKMLFIVNPYAGQRRIRRYLTEILEIFNQANYRVEIVITNGQGNAAEAVCDHAPEMDMIVCAGGDGTFNETINGVLRSGRQVPIGYIPCGTTNDFASSLKLSTNVLQAARDIVAGTPTPYDVGLFGDRYFSYVASFGAFTKASYATSQNVKNTLGHTAYVLSGIQELSQIRQEPIRIIAGDRVIEDEFIFGAISNSTSVGGILTLDPSQVDMGDGRFEVMLVRSPRSLAELTECIQALQSQKYNCSMITFFSTQEVTVQSQPELVWTLDGERQPGSQQIVAKNLHHAISIVK